MRYSVTECVTGYMWDAGNEFASQHRAATLHIMSMCRMSAYVCFSMSIIHYRNSDMIIVTYLKSYHCEIGPCIESTIYIVRRERNGIRDDVPFTRFFHSQHTHTNYIRNFSCWNTHRFFLHTHTHTQTDLDMCRMRFRNFRYTEPKPPTELYRIAQRKVGDSCGETSFSQISRTH